MIIGLSGYATSGKDTVADVLEKNYNFRRVAFADALKDFSLRVDPLLENGSRLSQLVEEYGWSVAKARIETRRFLQETGMAAREHFGHDVWINATHKSLGDYSGNVVFTDVRLKNEAEYITSLGGRIWRIERPGVGPANNHLSETDLDTWSFDRYINNSGSLVDLTIIVKMAMANV